MPAGMDGERLGIPISRLGRLSDRRSPFSVPPVIIEPEPVGQLEE
jgi:hypothetical protein